MADLAWHLAEVQCFWAAIVSGPHEEPADVEDLPRPAGRDVLGLLEQQSRALVEALSTARPGSVAGRGTTTGTASAGLPAGRRTRR